MAHPWVGKELESIKVGGAQYSKSISVGPETEIVIVLAEGKGRGCTALIIPTRK